MVLLDHVVHVFQGSKLRLSCRTMRGCVAIQRNRLRGAALAFDRFLEEGLGCSDISLGAEPEVYGLASPIHHPVEIGPLATNLQTSCFQVEQDFFPRRFRLPIAVTNGQQFLLAIGPWRSSPPTCIG
jgi:hypothetical protein